MQARCATVPTPPCHGLSPIPLSSMCRIFPVRLCTYLPLLLTPMVCDAASAFELLFAFDELIACGVGHRENLTLQQVQVRRMEAEPIWCPPDLRCLHEACRNPTS